MTPEFVYSKSNPQLLTEIIPRDISYENATGYHKRHSLIPTKFIKLPENPLFLSKDHSTVQQLSKVEDKLIQIPILANEQVISNAFERALSKLKEVINPEKGKTFFIYLMKGGHTLHQRAHQKEPYIIPKPIAFGNNSQEPNTGFISITRTKGTELTEQKPEIISGLEHYDPEQLKNTHLIIFEDLLDSNQSLQTVIDHAVEHSVKKITIVTLINKINIPNHPTQKEKTILQTPKNILLQIIVPIAIPGDYWVGGGIGCDYMEDIGRLDKILGVMIQN